MAAIIKIGIMGVMGVLLAVWLKAQKPEFAILLGIAVSVLIFGYVLGQLEALFGQFELLLKYLDTSGGYLAILLKVIGITYVCEFSAGICKDAGFGSVANQLEILGKLSVIFAGLPVLFAVIEQIQSLV